MARRARRSAETQPTEAPQGPADEPEAERVAEAAQVDESATEPEQDGPAAPLTRDEREAAERARMRAEIDRKFARAADRAVGGWARVTGSRARCDNPKCGVRARGSLRVYRAVHSEPRYDHTTSTGPGGGVQHSMTQSTDAHCTILCETCKLQQLVQEHGLAEMIEGNRLPPRQDVIQLTGVQLDAERYERLRVMAMQERANPTVPVVVPDVEKLRRREVRANLADDIEPLGANAIG